MVDYTHIHIHTRIIIYYSIDKERLIEKKGGVKSPSVTTAHVSQ
jgi:hypothetical protein